jgi:hypothetical protein
MKQRHDTPTTEVTHETERDNGTAVTLQPRIPKVLGSNFCWDTGCPDWNFRGLSQYLQESVGILSQLNHSHFLLNPIQFMYLPLYLCSLAHIPAGWRLETRLNWSLLYNHLAGTTQETQPLYC